MSLNIFYATFDIEKAVQNLYRSRKNIYKNIKITNETPKF